MHNFILLIALLLSAPFYGQTYITNVTVVDVEKQQLIQNQTVVITNDLIQEVNKSSKIKVPANATIIDGKGKFIIPGLTDAHIHFFQNGGLYTRPDAIDLRKYMPYSKELAYSKENMERVLHRYLKQGITNVIDVGSTYNFLEQRETFSDNAQVPSIYITGPLLTTYQPEAFKNLGKDEPFSLAQNVEDAVKMVREQLPFKPDFIKIWYIVGADGLGVEESARNNLPIIQAVIEEAHKNNLKVAVHATQHITAQLAVASGCDFLVHSVDDQIITPEFVALLKQKKTILCPTLTVSGAYLKTFGQNINFSNYELLTADPYQLGTLLDLKHIANKPLVDTYKSYANSRAFAAKKTDSISMVNLKILVDAGVTIATGTDAGNIGTLHGSSYLAELKAMLKAGMTTWQILEASTINGAKVLNKQDEFGTVTAGKKANLVLLNSNPIERIENITAIHAVINNGLVFNPNELLPDTPEVLAQRQLNAYNLRNLEAFLEPYAEDVEIYNYPDELVYTGKETMRKNYGPMFTNTPNLHCELLGRIVQGNVVIDKERVQFGNTILQATAIYHIENGKIKKVFFIR